jgi:hypothetical protein
MRRTDHKRLTRKLKELRIEARRRMHTPIVLQYQGCAAFCADILRILVCRAISTGLTPSIEKPAVFGIGRSIAEANDGSRGNASSGCSNVFPCRLPTSPILARWPLADLGKPQEEPSAGKPPARICEGEAEWLNYSTTTAKNASVRTSILSRGRASGGVVGSSKALWAVRRARPSFSESKHLNSNASSFSIPGK